MIRNADELEQALRRARVVLVTEVPSETAGWRSWWIVAPPRSPDHGYHLLRVEYDPGYIEDSESFSPHGVHPLAREHLPDVESVLERIRSIAPPERFEYLWKTDCPY